MQNNDAPQECLPFWADMPVTAKQARDLALAQVEQNARQDWLAAAATAVAMLSMFETEFTSDDVWECLAEVEAPAEPRALGAVMVAAARSGLIEKTDRVRNSVRVECHARPVAVWRSLRYVDIDQALAEDLDRHVGAFGGADPSPEV